MPDRRLPPDMPSIPLLWLEIVIPIEECSGSAFDSADDYTRGDLDLLVDFVVRVTLYGGVMRLLCLRAKDGGGLFSNTINPVSSRICVSS